MDYMATASDMREKAWSEVVLSPAFRAFRAADNMVMELGGDSAMPDFTPLPAVEKSPAPASAQTPRPRVRAKDGSLKQTQPEAAMAVLNELGPMGVKDIMEFAAEKGATVGGINPLNNFRSALSKDERFYSFRHNGDHLWWITGVNLPEGWDETATDLLNGAASLSSSQEGGDGHAANNTNLAS